jgi:hypothetical protein
LSESDVDRDEDPLYREGGEEEAPGNNLKNDRESSAADSPLRMSGGSDSEYPFRPFCFVRRTSSNLLVLGKSTSLFKDGRALHGVPPLRLKGGLRLLTHNILISPVNGIEVRAG